MATRLVVAAIAAISVLGGAAFPSWAARSGVECKWKKTQGNGRVVTQSTSGTCDLNRLMGAKGVIDLDTGETVVIRGPGKKHRASNRGGPVGAGAYDIPAWRTDPRLSLSDAARAKSPVVTTSPFVVRGTHFRPILGGYRSQGIHDRNAVDLATSCGRAVLASSEGTVRIANGGKSKGKGRAWNGGYGRYVVIDHPDGKQTLYAHLSRVLVAVGQFVEQGFPIGLVGSTGHSTGCHVHFEVRGGKNPF